MPGPGALVESTESLGRPALLHLLHARAHDPLSPLPLPIRDPIICVCVMYTVRCSYTVCNIRVI